MKRGAVIGLVAAAAVVVGGGVLWWAMTRPPSAENAAHAYLSALQAGDVDAVLAMRSSTQASTADEQLSAAFLGAASYLTDPQIVAVAVEGDDRARVEATALFSGDRHGLTFDLVREDERWLLGAEYMGRIEVDTTLGDSVWVGGALVGVDAGALALLPAVYPVSAAPFGALSGGAEIAVPAGHTPTRLTVEAAVAPEATAIVQTQVDEYAQQCATTAPAVPTHCGLKIPWAADLSALESISYRIERSPAVTLAEDGRTFDAIDGVIVATATGTPRRGTQSSFTYRTGDWALRGLVTLRGNELTLAVY